jgi:hypothetical protein
LIFLKTLLKKLTKLYNLFRIIFVELNPQLKRYYLFLGASLVFSIGLQIGLGYLGVPWFVSIGIVMGLFILLPMIMRKRYMNKMSGYGGDSGTGGGGFFGMGSQGGSSGVQYVCLVCNNKHKGGTCPRCGSKMQRADF